MTKKRGHLCKANHESSPVFPRSNHFHDTQRSRDFPPEPLEQSPLLLVYDPQDGQRRCGCQGLVERNWCSAAVGKPDTRFDAIIGVNAALSIEFGTDMSEALKGVNLVRSITPEVDRDTKKIKAVVRTAKAKNNEVGDSSVRCMFPPSFF